MGIDLWYELECLVWLRVKGNVNLWLVMYLLIIDEMKIYEFKIFCDIS